MHTHTASFPSPRANTLSCPGFADAAAGPSPDGSTGPAGPPAGPDVEQHVWIAATLRDHASCCFKRRFLPHLRWRRRGGPLEDEPGGAGSRAVPPSRCRRTVSRADVRTSCPPTGSRPPGAKRSLHGPSSRNRRVVGARRRGHRDCRRDTGRTVVAGGWVRLLAAMTTVIPSAIIWLTALSRIVEAVRRGSGWRRREHRRDGRR